MTSTFVTFTHTLLDKSEQPVTGPKAKLSSSYNTVKDATDHKTYAPTPKLVFDEDGNLCIKADDGSPAGPPGVRLIVGVQYTYKPITTGLFEPITFTATADNPTVDYSQLIDEPPSVAPTDWEQLVSRVSDLENNPSDGTVQAVNEVAPDVDGNITLPATSIPFTPTGTIAATTVQAAIAEVASEAGGGGATLGETVNVVSATGSTETLPAPTTASSHDLTLTADCAITLPTWTSDGKLYSILVTLRQPHSGGSYEYGATWVGTVRWTEGGDAPEIASGQDAFTEVVLKSRDGGVTWEGSSTLPNPGNQGMTLTIDGSGNVATPADQADIFDLTLTQNAHMSAPTGLTRNKMLMWAVRQDATGGRTLTYDAVFRFSSVLGEPFLSITGNKTDYLVGRFNAIDNKIDMAPPAPGY